MHDVEQSNEMPMSKSQLYIQEFRDLKINLLGIFSTEESIQMDDMIQDICYKILYI